MDVQISLKDEEDGSVSIKVEAVGENESFTDPASGEPPTNAEAMAAAFLGMVQAQEDEHKRQQETQAKHNAEQKKAVQIPEKKVLGPDGKPVN